MKRDLGLYLEDVLESVDQIQKYTKNINEDEFYKNLEKQDAVLRRFAIIGEAIKQLPKRYRDKYPHIQWKKIAGMRDVLIHEYFGVNLKRVWDTIQQDLPEFGEQIKLIHKETS